MPAWAEWPRYRPPRSQGLLVVQRLGDIAMKQTGKVLSVRLSAIAFALIATQGAFADDDESGGCVGLPSQAQLKPAASTSRCGPPSSTATAWCARSRFQGPIAGRSGQGAA